MTRDSDDRLVWAVGAFFVLGIVLSTSAQAALLSSSDAGFGGQTRSQNYETLMNSLFANGNTTQVISGDKLWVPWMGSSSSCTMNDLKSGSSCNSGESIDWTHNCMVTDEFSQVGILVAMGQNPTRMQQFYNTVLAIPSNSGVIPAWRVYRSGNTIEQCRSGVNGNCDTASDATARIIISLFTAANNTAFSTSERNSYRSLGTTMSADFVKYELDKNCRQSNLGHGQICYWMAAGANAKNGGLASTDYAYTGYFADGIIAMLAACAQTNNQTYCAVAGNLTLNYLQAANYTGSSFVTPPGRSFKWVNTNGVPIAQCTNTCSPDQWDGADAIRALGMCHALYYAEQMDVTLPSLSQYCALWKARHATSATSIPLQYRPDGSASGASQSGYLAQGLQSLFHTGANSASFETSLDSALAHYSVNGKTWDNAACFGIYNQAFAIRALGVGIGRDEAAFSTITGLVSIPDVPVVPDVASLSISAGSPAQTLSIAEPSNQSFSFTLVNPTSIGTTTTWFINGVNQTASMNFGTFTFRGNYSAAGSYNVTARVSGAGLSAQYSWTLTVTDTVVVNITNTTVTLANVSFASTSPAQAITIAEPANRTFSVTLSNPDNVLTTISWLLNGVNQTASFNGGSFTFRGNASAAGTYNVTARMVSSQNILQYSWTLTVTDTPEPVTTNTTEITSTPVTSKAKKGGGGGGGGGGAVPTSEPIAPTTERPSAVSESADTSSPEVVKTVVESYFTGKVNLKPERLVKEIRDYYATQQVAQ